MEIVDTGTSVGVGKAGTPDSAVGAALSPISGVPIPGSAVALTAVVAVGDSVAFRPIMGEDPASGKFR